MEQRVKVTGIDGKGRKPECDGRGWCHGESVTVSSVAAATGGLGGGNLIVTDKK